MKNVLTNTINRQPYHIINAILFKVVETVKDTQYR